MWHDLTGFVFNVDLLDEYGIRLLLGLRITAEVVAISCGLGFLLSYPVARARMSRRRLIAYPALAFVSCFRGTPLLCQLYLV